MEKFEIIYSEKNSVWYDYHLGIKAESWAEAIDKLKPHINPKTGLIDVDSVQSNDIDCALGAIEDLDTIEPLEPCMNYGNPTTELSLKDGNRTPILGLIPEKTDDKEEIESRLSQFFNENKDGFTSEVLSLILGHLRITNTIQNRELVNNYFSGNV